MNEETIEEKARTVLRSYLIRCHKTISIQPIITGNYKVKYIVPYNLHNITAVFRLKCKNYSKKLISP
jgi:hypothetical protein